MLPVTAMSHSRRLAVTHRLEYSVRRVASRLERPLEHLLAVRHKQLGAVLGAQQRDAPLTTIARDAYRATLEPHHGLWLRSTVRAALAWSNWS